MSQHPFQAKKYLSSNASSFQAFIPIEGLPGLQSAGMRGLF
jgi:hypothetical protein